MQVLWIRLIPNVRAELTIHIYLLILSLVILPKIFTLLKTFTEELQNYKDIYSVGVCDLVMQVKE